MPIEHIVLIEKKETTPEEKLDAFFHSVNSLKDKIPGIFGAQIGENLAERAPHSRTVIVTMEDRELLWRDMDLIQLIRRLQIY